MQYDQFETLYGDQIPRWQVGPMRLHYANTYERLVGAHPDERHRLRAKLQQLLGSASPPSLPVAQANGSEPPIEASDVFA